MGTVPPSHVALSLWWPHRFPPYQRGGSTAPPPPAPPHPLRISRGKLHRCRVAPLGLPSRRLTSPLRGAFSQPPDTRLTPGNPPPKNSKIQQLTQTAVSSSRTKTSQETVARADVARGGWNETPGGEPPQPSVTKARGTPGDEGGAARAHFWSFSQMEVLKKRHLRIALQIG